MSPPGDGSCGALWTEPRFILGIARAGSQARATDPRRRFGPLRGHGPKRPQGTIHLEALAAACALERVFVYDVAPEAAARLAREAAARLDIAVAATRDLGRAVSASDIVVTCTTSRTPLIAGARARDPRARRVVVDSLEQCAAIGEVHHALAAGIMTREAVHADLGQLAAGQRRGRTSPGEITVFDSTGTALQDGAAAALVYERARETGVGLALELAA